VIGAWVVLGGEGHSYLPVLLLGNMNDDYSAISRAVLSLPKMGHGFTHAKIHMNLRKRKEPVIEAR
jgi:hypothetical protein